MFIFIHRQRYWIQPNCMTLELMREFPQVRLHNLPYNSVPTAETALALVLACSKFVALADRNLRNNDWTIRYSEQPQILLSGKSVMILGYGRSGRHLAPIFHAMGMRVLGVRATVQPADAHDPHADLLPQDAIVVNVGRGPVLDEEALYNALKSGKLAGAGIDVWYNYPRAVEERTNTAPMPNQVNIERGY